MSHPAAARRASLPPGAVGSQPRGAKRRHRRGAVAPRLEFAKRTRLGANLPNLSREAQPFFPFGEDLLVYFEGLAFTQFPNEPLAPSALRPSGPHLDDAVLSKSMLSEGYNEATIWACHIERGCSVGQCSFSSGKPSQLAQLNRPPPLIVIIYISIFQIYRQRRLASELGNGAAFVQLTR